MALTDIGINSTKEVIARLVEHYKSPAMLCSFGKDSMVLLHLLRSMNVTLPLVFLKDPWFPKKYRVAAEIAAKWDLVVHDYSPSRVSMWEGTEIMAYTNHYQIGQAELAVPKNILEPVASERYICGLRDILRRPLGTFQMPWDALLVGHKSSDEDQIAGKVTLHTDVRSGAMISPDMCFPLRHWTDEDVWDYTERYGVPQQGDRYDVEKRCELKDKSANSDYARVCIECIDKRKAGQVVLCPQLQMEVTNIAAVVPYEEVRCGYFGK